MALLLGLHSRMFSGFRSQWMMLSSGVARNSSAVHNCWANFRVRFKETPLKFVFRNKSYRLYDNISNTKQRWFRNMKCRFKCTEKRNTFRYFFFNWRNALYAKILKWYQRIEQAAYLYSISSLCHVCSWAREAVLQFELDSERPSCSW